MICPLAKDDITYHYDQLGRMTNRAINGVAETMRATDTLGRVTTYTNILGTFTRAYVDDTRRLSSLAYPNGQMTAYDYFDVNIELRLKQIWNKNASGGNISKFDYDYDVLGRIKQWTQQAGAGTPNVWSMEYDNEDQLINVLITPQSGSATKGFTYAYDDMGNRNNVRIVATDLGANGGNVTSTGARPRRSRGTTTAIAPATLPAAPT